MTKRKEQASKGKRRVKIEEGSGRGASFGGEKPKGPKIIDDGGYARAEARVKQMAAQGRFTEEPALVRTGFVPGPWRHYPPSPEKREHLTVAEARDQIHEQDGRITTMVSVKGRIVLNAVGPIDSPAHEQRPYSVVCYEEVS